MVSGLSGIKPQKTREVSNTTIESTTAAAPAPAAAENVDDSVTTLNVTEFRDRMPSTGDKVFSKSSTEVEIGNADSAFAMPLAPGNPGFVAVRDAALTLAAQECMAGIKGFRLAYWNEGKSIVVALPAMRGAIASLPHSPEAKKAIAALSELRRTVHRLTGDAGASWVFHASNKRSFALYGQHTLQRA